MKIELLCRSYQIILIFFVKKSSTKIVRPCFVIIFKTRARNTAPSTIIVISKFLD